MYVKKLVLYVERKSIRDILKHIWKKCILVQKKKDVVNIAGDEQQNVGNEVVDMDDVLGSVVQPGSEQGGRNIENEDRNIEERNVEEGGN